MSNTNDQAIIDKYMVSIVTELHTNLEAIRDNITKSFDNSRAELYDTLARESGEETLFYTVGEIYEQIMYRIIKHNDKRDESTNIKHIYIRLNLNACRADNFNNTFYVNCIIMANVNTIISLPTKYFNNTNLFIRDIAKLLNRLKFHGIVPIDPISHGIELYIQQKDNIKCRKVIRSLLLNNGHLLTLYRPTIDNFDDVYVESICDDMLCLNSDYTYSEEHFHKALKKPLLAKFIVDTIISSNIVTDQQLYMDFDISKTYCTYNYKLYNKLNIEYLNSYKVKNRKRKIDTIE